MNPLKFTKKGETMQSAENSAFEGTLTSEGWVPFLHLDGVDMPVALNIPEGALATHLSLPQAPLRVGEALVYVAPGGELVVGPGEPVAH